MKKENKKLLAFSVVSFFLGSTFTVGAAPILKTVSAIIGNDMNMKVNGQAWKPKDQKGNFVYPLIVNGNSYLPVRPLAEALQAEISYNAETRTISIGKSAEKREEVKGNYLYKELKTRIYKKDGADEYSVIENQFYQDGYMQAKNNSDLMDLLYSNDKGLYAVIPDDIYAKNENIIAKAKQFRKEPILKFPLQVGQISAWESNPNVQFKVLALNETVKTPVETFRNVAKVEFKAEDVTIYYWMHPTFGIVQFSVNNGKDVYLLKEIKGRTVAEQPKTEEKPKVEVKKPSENKEKLRYGVATGKVVFFQEGKAKVQVLEGKTTTYQTFREFYVYNMKELDRSRLKEGAIIRFNYIWDSSQNLQFMTTATEGKENTFQMAGYMSNFYPNGTFSMRSAAFSVSGYTSFTPMNEEVKKRVESLKEGEYFIAEYIEDGGKWFINRVIQ